MSQEDWKEGSDQVIFNANYLPYLLASLNFLFGLEREVFSIKLISHVRSLQKSLELLKADLIPLAFSLKTFLYQIQQQCKSKFH